jgi:16S rRNA processing protein RimM
MPGGSRICLGQIGAAHGVAGEVRLRSFTSDPQAIADYGPLETEDGRVLLIESLRPTKDHFVARLSGVADRSAAAHLTNEMLYVPRERLPPPDDADEFYHADLVGLAVVDPAGGALGTVIAIYNFGAGDVIEVQLDGVSTTELVPFDTTHVPAVDIAAGKIVVVPFPVAGEGGEAKPSRVRGWAERNSKMISLARTAAGLRRQRSTLPGKGKGSRG